MSASTDDDLKRFLADMLPREIEAFQFNLDPEDRPDDWTWFFQWKTDQAPKNWENIHDSSWDYIVRKAAGKLSFNQQRELRFQVQRITGCQTDAFLSPWRTRAIAMAKILLKQLP